MQVILGFCGIIAVFSLIFISVCYATNATCDAADAMISRFGKD